MGLLVEQARSGGEIDRLFKPGALVVEPIYGARQLDEPIAKVVARLAIADSVLDVPERCIHPFELGAEFVQHRAIHLTEADGPQGFKPVDDILQLARILDTLGLYFEDSDFVHQFADRDRHQDVLWRAILRVRPALSSAFSLCAL